MARTNRRIHNRLPWAAYGYPERYSVTAAESCCKPGCGLCETGPNHRRTRSKRRRAADKHALREQVAQ